MQNVDKTFVPFGGVYGWLADLTVPAKNRTGARVSSYYAAVTDQWRALVAIRNYAKLEGNADLAPRRALSMREVQMLGMKPGQVKRA